MFKEPPRWVRDVILAIGIGVLLLAGQWLIDDRRSDREAKVARALFEQSERLENLRFVRDRSGPDRVVLLGATVFGTDFTDANLAGANMLGAWVNADTQFDGTDLSGVEFFDSQLFGVDFSKTKNFDGADLHGACWNDETRWPSDFVPPENSPAETCH